MANIKQIKVGSTTYDMHDTYANIAYGTCSTAAATAAKVVTIDGNPNWELKTGSIITVKFTNTNTAASPTLNVNNTGAKPIYYDNAVYTSSSSYGGYANRHITYQYDGTNWVFISWGYDSDTVTQAAAITTAGEYPVILGYSTATTAVTNTVNKTTTLKYNPSTQVLTAPTFKGTLDGNADSASTAETLSNTLTIDKGGTNAVTAPEARENLGFTYGSAEPSGTPDGGEGSVYFRTGGDAVVEVGTDGMWTYEKRASGIAKCWGTLTITVSTWDAWGGMYEQSTGTPGVAYPTGLFAATPQIYPSASGSVGNAGIEFYGGNSATKTPTMFILRGSSTSSTATFEVYLLCIGRWK